MAELRTFLPTVVAVLASSEACDLIEAPEGVTIVRVAPCEVLLVGPADPHAVGDRRGGSGAIVEDVSDAWTAFELQGDDAPDVLARLTELELPGSGWTQGEVAGAAAKVLVEPGRLTLLVPAMLGAHVEQRIRADASELLSP